MFVCVFLRRFNVWCYAPGFYMLLFLRQMFMMRVCVCVCACVRACVRACVCVEGGVVHWHCSAQLSMFNMEKRYRNKIIIIIISTMRGTPLLIVMILHHEMSRNVPDGHFHVLHFLKVDSMLFTMVKSISKSKG